MDDSEVKAARTGSGRCRPVEHRAIVPGQGSGRFNTAAGQATAPGSGLLRRLAGDDSSRQRFLKMVGGAGAGGFALLVAACGDEDEDTAGDTTPADEADAAGRDLDILNYALTLEFLAAGFYRAVVDAGVIEEQLIAETLRTFGDQEQEHVDAIRAAIEQMGGTPAEEPSASFESVIDDGPETVLATAARIENVGAAAYLYEAPRIQSGQLLAAALAIHSVEAAHAAALNELAGIGFTGGGRFEGSIPDGAFAAEADRDTVMQEFEPFLQGGGSGNDGDGEAGG